MGKLSKEVLRLASDNGLIRNALALRQAIESIEEEGIVPEGHGLIEELNYNLQVMEKEIEQRGLKMAESDGQDDFLQGAEYESEAQSRDRGGSVNARLSRISAQVSK